MQPQKKAIQVLDPEFEAAINSYADAVIEEEKEKFQPGIESFKVHADRLRDQVRTSMLRYQQNFQKGVEAIYNWLDARKIARPVIDEKNLVTIQSLDEFQQQVNEGKYLHEIFGFSEDTLKTFYQAAYQMAQDKDFAKARDAFFFLVYIAPYVCDFWVGLAISATQLKEYDTVRDATLHALALNPLHLDSYLNGVHIYLMFNEPELAKDLCKRGLEAVEASSKEPWANDFTRVLKEALSIISQRGA